MRWNNLEAHEVEQATLPGYRDAVVRHFDAPEALDTSFYEVYAKSALNRVPKNSRVPFRWTINPYRGCSHACVYCMLGETRVLMGDGRTRPLKELQVGDVIYGTQRQEGMRRYVKTQVLAHWSNVKPAYRVTLDDGTELVTSADHRFLTYRGWKHVTGTEQGHGRRPHLTVGSKLLGTGRFSTGPASSPGYEQGYLCGMVRGDAHMASYPYSSPAGDRYQVNQFRLALADQEALERSKSYLANARVDAFEYAYSAATDRRRPLRAIRTGARSDFERITQLIRWPLSPTNDWRRGFLAGIFDAEGSGSGVIRIANCDETILNWVRSCLTHFGFDALTERTAKHNGLCYIRLRGGLSERLRFFHTVDPAIRRKLDIDGRAVRDSSCTSVASIEPLGMELPLFDITTGTGDFIADGVVSHNCFARPTHIYLGFDAGRDFEKEIVVKVNVPEVLRAELRRASWAREHVAMGTNTDPYQWVEGRYRLMPGIWEALRDARTPASVLTKSPLLLRDVELMQELGEVADVSANLSVPTLDEKAWRATEPHTPHPRARLEAVAELNRAGIPTGVLAAPLMPGINDAPEQVEALLAAADEAGAVGVGGIALHLRGETRGVFMDWLRSARPDLVPRYEGLYARGAYAPQAERRRLAALVCRPGAPSPSRFDGGDGREAFAPSPRLEQVQE
ncbi:MAG: intein-containing Rv2578c family radical SAM protein, partial [Actinomycetota bacterium]|nr:intein-containing Rv2578c family radical SAM protein [Actinomycetota bacterium]